MKINDIIVEAEDKDADTGIWQGTKDFVKSIPSRAVSGAQTIGDWQRGGINYVTGGGIDKLEAGLGSTIKGTDYEKELSKARERSASAEKRSPKAYKAIKGTIEDPIQTQADYARSLANELTFGGADYAMAAADQLTGGSGKQTYQQALDKQRDYDLAAAKRSPAATKAGEVASYILPGVFTGGASIAARGGAAAAKAVAPSVVKALAPVAGQTAKNVVKGVAKAVPRLGTEIAGGLGAEKAVKSGAKKIDPENIYAYDTALEETTRLKELVKYRNR